MNIGFTGSRNGLNENQISELRKVLSLFFVKEAHHGDCLGADLQFHNVCLDNKIAIIIHPPDREALRAFCSGGEILSPRPFLERNKDIVANCDVLIAGPESAEVLRSGTWSTVRCARKSGKLRYILPQEGGYYKED